MTYEIYRIPHGYFTIQELAKIGGIKESTIYSLIRRGVIPAIKYDNSHWCIAPGIVAAYLEKRYKIVNLYKECLSRHELRASSEKG